MKVSVLIPAKNAAEFIEETLESALVQMRPEDEIIVVDDGSEDNTLDLIESVRKRNSAHIHLFHGAQRGACAARNLALASSQGEVIQWLDADDLLAPGKLDHARSMAERHPLHLACTPWVGFQGNPMKSKPAASFWAAIPEHSNPSDWLARDVHTVPHCFSGRRNLFKAAGGWDETLRINQDGEYFSRVIARSAGVLFYIEPAVLYRQEVKNGVSRFNPTKADSLFRSIQSMSKTALKLEDSERMRQMISNRWQHFIYTAYPHAPELRRQAEALLTELPSPTLPNPQTVSRASQLFSQLFGWKTLMHIRQWRGHV